MNVRSRDLQVLNRLLDTALSLPVAERESWLEHLRGEDEALSSLLRTILTHRDLAEQGGFLSTLPSVTGIDPPLPAAHAEAGQLVGPYRLVRELGTGGMGSVWLAERIDGLLQRRVALKLPLLGAFAGLTERMARERAILAKLEHPNIARLYDAGVAADGRPYLALEYVEGEPIDVYCRTRELDLRARLELALQVARAVVYAHAHLTIHRDLKPSNILVDSDGQVHLLDFGVAKLLGDDTAGPTASDTSITRQVGAALTLDYASPEQIRGESVSAASDVYSLGVVLYELLANKRPYEIKRVDLLSVAQTIATVEPAPPSEVVADPGLCRALRGDLDTIVLKALRKAVADRYGTVSELVDDIERYLRREPVRARRPTLGYRFTKLVQRNRVATIGSILVALSLCAGIITTAWQARRALEQEHLAKDAQARAEQRFNDARQFAHSILFDYHDAIKDLPGATPVRARLVHDALEYLDRIAKDAADDLPLQRELAAAYERVGDIQGGTMSQNLGDTQGALLSARTALALRERIVAAHPGDRDTLLELAISRRKIAVLYWELGNMQPALAEAQRALSILVPLSQRSPSSRVLQALAKTHDYLGEILQERGDLKEAQAEYAKSSQILESGFASGPEDPELLRAQSVVREHEGTALQLSGDLPAALARHRQALQLRQRLLAGAPLNSDYERTVLVSWYNIGEVLGALGDTRQALESYRRDLAIGERLMAADPRNEEYRGDVAYALIRVGDMLVLLGRPRDALVSYRRSLSLRAADVARDPVNLWKRSSLIEAHAKSARALAADDPAAALDWIDRTVSLMQATHVEPENAVIRSFFAETYADLGDVHLGLAQRPTVAGASAHLTRAQEMFRRAADIWASLEARGALSSSDVKRRKAAQASMLSVRRQLALPGARAAHTAH